MRNWILLFLSSSSILVGEDAQPSGPSIPYGPQVPGGPLAPQGPNIIQGPSGPTSGYLGPSGGVK